MIEVETEKAWGALFVVKNRIVPFLKKNIYNEHNSIIFTDYLESVVAICGYLETVNISAAGED